MMMTKALASLMVMGVMGRGCGRAQVAPATRPVGVVAAEVLPGDSKLVIDGKECAFRVGRIVVEPVDEGLLVRVFSEGASVEGANDGYYLEMRVDGGTVDGAGWEYASASKDRPEEMGSVITVNGGGNQLMPREVRVGFREVSEKIVEVKVAGVFHIFKGRDGMVAVGAASVEGTILAVRQ